MGDWLGTGFVATRERKYRPFEEAREYARSLGLKNVREWEAYARSGEKLDDIPYKPQRTYKDAGWRGWADFLGNGFIHASERKWRPFGEAREYARGLGLRSYNEWRAWRRENRPEDIPASPPVVYKESGWVSWGDFLGTDNYFTRDWRPFEEAREHARSLGLKNTHEWLAYARSEECPEDIPIDPRHIYEHSGWVSTGDWLGTGYVANQERQYRSYEEARAFVRTLGLKSEAEWREYAKSGQKPDDIPASPESVYGHKWKRR
jgi:hypothetical protein